MTDRHPFLPDCLLLLVGIYLATLHLFAPPVAKEPAQRDPARDTPLNIVLPDNIPAGTRELTLLRDSDGLRYRLADGERTDEEGVKRALQQLASEHPGAPVRLRAGSEGLTQGELATISDVGIALGLFVFVVAGQP